ncbi:hypothetical protein CDD83_8508 [Cordyceps sp. RAO-2017]|nr:hypothetical protein CDD83_8508 [Cordyceps sp. RAO-2017]
MYQSFFGRPLSEFPEQSLPATDEGPRAKQSHGRGKGRRGLAYAACFSDPGRDVSKSADSWTRRRVSKVRWSLCGFSAHARYMAKAPLPPSQDSSPDARNGLFHLDRSLLLPTRPSSGSLRAQQQVVAIGTAAVPLWHGKAAPESSVG